MGGRTGTHIKILGIITRKNMVYSDCDNAYDIIKAKPEFKKCF